MPKILTPAITQNITIVSGLAIGVDSLAHQIAAQNNKPTIAVLGSGIDKNSMYPKQNANLVTKIIETNGLIISEYPPYTEAIPANFPRRNRIISGLCQATLIVEAAERSGSLITAYQALEQNRDVMAIPGNITLTNSLGTNKMIQRGAKPILIATDILEAYSLKQNTTNTNNYKSLAPIERTILQLLNNEKLSVDKLHQKSKIDIVQLNATLSIMEVKGLIKSSGGTYYSL
jgi:DNA processing protein